MNLLDAKLYDPSSAVSKSTASLLAMTAFDTTNLRLTVTVPAHGMLRVRMQCNLSGATTMPQVVLGVLDGSTVRGRQVPLAALPGTALATTNVPLVADFVITGLTPGSITLDAAYGVETVVAATNIHYGGPNNTTGNDAWGAFSFEIWDPRPMKLGLDGGVNVTQFGGTAGTFAGGRPEVNTTHAAGTAWGSGAITAAAIAAAALNGKGDWNIGKTGYALSAAGVQAIWDALTSALTTVGSIGKKLADWVIGTAQTGDAFARLGAPAGASVSADIAAVKAQTQAIEVDTAEIGAAGAGLTAITGKTNALPSDPADQSLIIDATNAIMSRLGAPVGASMSADIAAVQADADNIQTRLPAALSGGRMVSAVEAIDAPTANKVADHTLRRSYANARASADGDAVSFRSMLGAIAKLVNKWGIAAGVLTIYHEDDATPVGTQAVTGTAGADPVTSIDTN